MRILAVNIIWCIMGSEDSVVYCSGCLSLNIRSVGVSGDVYCGECGGCVVEESGISEWERKYESRYGERYIKNIKNKEEEICQIERGIRRLKI